MPQRMRLGPTSGGSIDTVRALVQLDQTDFEDLELSAETRNLILNSVSGDVLPGGDNPNLGTDTTPWPTVATDAVAGGVTSTAIQDFEGTNLSVDGSGVLNATDSSYTDEDAQDAVGGILSSQFTYDDAGNAIDLNPHENDADAHHAKYTDSEAAKAEALKSPDSIQIANVDDGESTDIVIPVQDGETLTIYKWGVLQMSDRTAPTSLEVRLLDNSDTQQASANTTHNENTNGITSLSNSSGGLHFYRIRWINNTGGNIPEIAGFVGYVVE